MKPWAVLSAIGCLALSRTAQAVDPTVRIDSGPVQGTTTFLPQATAPVAKFLGIPFAAPPQRFSPPAKPRAWTRAIRATSFKPACIQQFSKRSGRDFVISVANTPPAEESEDCLYLNVYAPASPSPGRGRTVLFWLYGGSLQYGNAGVERYDGSSFAAYQDVVVVTSNYRSNVFGFPSSPEIALNRRNLGFLDQRLALDWVQRNIDVFGGDPDKVTIFGESTGALSIDALLTSYGRNERPPFRAAILQSGQLSYRALPLNPAASAAAWQKLAKELNCHGNRTLACVREDSIKAEKIKQIIEDGNLSFTPHVDNRTLMSDPAGRRSNGAIAVIPVLIGSNSQEGRIFAQGQTDVVKYVQATFRNDSTVVKAVVAAYPIGKDGLKNGYDAISQIVTDFGFQCNTAMFAMASIASGIPTWRYYFNATFPNLQTFPDAGVVHASEIKLIFGTYGKGSSAVNSLPSPPQQVQLSEFMQGAWARFAKDPWSGPGWTAVGGSPSGADLGNIGSTGSTGVTVIKPSDVDGKCGIFNPLYKKAAELSLRELKVVGIRRSYPVVRR